METKGGLTVLSLFDGISCGRVALERAGIPVKAYYASEVDKYAMQISKKNWPDIIQIGDVTQIEPDFIPDIDLLIGGSPCQGFSFAGKQLNFDDPRSKLFFDYVRLLEALRKRNPNIKFLLENVNMKQESQDVISKYLGVGPEVIDSALFSAQRRKRLYWTNIPYGPLPVSKNISLQSILESGQSYVDKSYCLTASYPGAVIWNSLERKQRTMVAEKAEHGYEVFLGELQIKGKYLPINLPDGFYRFRKFTPVEACRLQNLPDFYTQGAPVNQALKSIGNGWTVDVIAHIFKGLK